MRLFIALDIADDIRQRIGRFLAGVSGFSPEARWVRLESLHITLKFIGEKPPELVSSLQDRLSNVSVPSFAVTFSGTGFFPTPKSARVFWIGIQAPPNFRNWPLPLTMPLLSLGYRKKSEPSARTLHWRARAEALVRPAD